MKYDVGTRLYELKDAPILYYLVAGLTYSEIAERHYYRHKNKVIYIVRKLLKEFKFRNRRQLACFAVLYNLVEMERVKHYISA